MKIELNTIREQWCIDKGFAYKIFGRYYLFKRSTDATLFMLRWL
jgi:hypothetical protein